MNIYFGRFLLLYFLSDSAFADKPYPIITFTCDQTADVIKVKNEIKWGEKGQNFKYSPTNGTYNPWQWVTSDNSDGYKKSKKIELSCQLSNGLYKVILEPKLFAHRFSDNCGQKISAKVTIFRGGALLLDKQPLEEFCRGNVPIIRGVKVFGKTGKVKLYRLAKHRFY